MDNINSLSVVGHQDITLRKIAMLIICVVIPIGVGAISGFITKDNMMVFDTIKKPALTPPAIVFPIAWAILYVLMGLASYIALIKSHDLQQAIYMMYPYAIQLVLNFMWSIIFFNYNLYNVAFVCLLFLWIMIIRTITFWGTISNLSVILMMPYIMWVTFAAYLNLSIVMLN